MRAFEKQSDVLFFHKMNLHTPKNAYLNKCICNAISCSGPFYEANESLYRCSYTLKYIQKTSYFVHFYKIIIKMDSRV